MGLLVVAVAVAPIGCGKLIKEGVKQAAKQGAKRAGKQGTKQAVKQTARVAAGQMVKEVGKSLLVLAIAVAAEKVVKAGVTDDGELEVEMRMPDGSTTTVTQQLTEEQLQHLKQNDGRFEVEVANGERLSGQVKPQ